MAMDKSLQAQGKTNTEKKYQAIGEAVDIER